MHFIIRRYMKNSSQILYLISWTDLKLSFNLKNSSKMYTSIMIKVVPYTKHVTISGKVVPLIYIYTIPFVCHNLKHSKILAQFITPVESTERHELNMFISFQFSFQPVHSLIFAQEMLANSKQHSFQKYVSFKVFLKY